MLDFLSIGDAVLDTHVKIDDATVECNLDGRNCKLCLDYAGKIPITGSFQAIGGDGANIAAGAAALGLQTAIIATVGADSTGNILAEEIRKQKVATDYLYVDNTTKTRYSVVLNFQGERTILAYHQKRRYIWPKTMPEVDWIYFSGVSEGFEPLQDKLVDFLKKHPTVRLAFTPGSYQLKFNMDLVREMVAKADVIIVNLEEAEAILDTTLKNEKSVPALIHKMRSLGAKEVIITDGIKGAWTGNDDEIWYLEPYPVKVISKTGAGDAFSSAYIAARFYGHALSKALEWGTANSCSVIGQFGAQKGLLDQKGIEAMIKKFPDAKLKKV